MNNWKDTNIWKRLSKIKGDESEKVKSFLNDVNCMDKIQMILNKGITSPKDFTLHDADHSFRVAQRMWEIIPTSTQKILSEFELAILLLSAYLHDIGMTPELKKVNNLYAFLNTKNKSCLNNTEQKDLQKWLDEEGEQIDITNEVIDDADKVAQLVIYYCRYKHNEWSEEWIRNNLQKLSLGNYTNWLNDLVDICQSHHHGLDDLKKEKFNPLRTHKKVIHKRYIAMCLRLADVIEIDPERAPEVLITHRNIIQGSLSHWLKEKFTSVDILNGFISITARPDKAFIHKAILDISDQIEHESNLCNTLQTECPLCNILPDNNLKHIWNISPSISKNIKEAGNYEFIDGTFKPNSKKLLQLFAGTELYGNPLLAIRELIQNAIDAVKIQIGYKVLDEKLTKAKKIELIKNNFNIELTVINENEENWIICKDNGVGMDKDTIKKCFLVGGATKQHEILELERKCRKQGYDLELTGQFGIGVLSYFMIADKVLINTRKSIQAGNHETNGWEFEINSLSDFGELRISDFVNNGTEIKLRLKKEIFDLIKDTTAIEDLIKNYLIKIPCNFKYIATKGKMLRFKPGWCKDKNYFKTQIIQQFDSLTTPEVKTSLDFVSEEQESIINISQKRKREIENNFENSINFLIYDGVLKNKNGYLRIHVPVFLNKMGDSFAFFFELLKNKQLFLQKINNGFLFYPRQKTPMISWKGFGMQKQYHFSNSDFGIPAYVEIDLINNKSFQISVSRREILFGTNFDDILNEINSRIQELLIIHQRRFSNNVYSFFNYLLAPFLPFRDKSQYWISESDYKKDLIKFDKIKFPVKFDISTQLGEYTTQLYMRKVIKSLNSFESCGNDYLQSHFSINANRFKLDLAVYHDYYNFRISFIKNSLFIDKNEYSFVGNSAHFPLNWQKLFCFRGYDKEDIILNLESPYIKFINNEDYEYIKDFFESKKLLSSDAGKLILDKKSKCFCFMLYIISQNKKNYWDSVTKSNKVFIKNMWQKMFGDSNETLYFFHDGISNTSLNIITSNNWKIHREYDEIITILPIPSDKWHIVDKEMNIRISKGKLINKKNKKTIFHAGKKTANQRLPGKISFV